MLLHFVGGQQLAVWPSRQGGGKPAVESLFAAWLLSTWAELCWQISQKVALGVGGTWTVLSGQTVNEVGASLAGVISIGAADLRQAPPHARV